jgi:hypothetical protein
MLYNIAHFQKLVHSMKFEESPEMYVAAVVVH